ncbi:hypothetical protein [Nocardia sp. NPDC049707]|uniref:hypothetical protein n=1 Tax=Nocardia sp. NPDC049707 TaxID=3154735 RepID=UPI003427D836
MHDLDISAAPVAVLARDEIAAVLLESHEKRFVVFVPHEGGEWVAPGMTSGTPRRVSQPRAQVTGQVPLVGLAGRGFAVTGPDGEPEKFGWFAMTGQAAADAVEVSFTSTVDVVTEPVGESGLVFAIVRTQMIERQDGLLTFEKPTILVHTRDGRSVAMHS